MISRDSFIKIVSEIDNYWSNKMPLLQQLGIEESYFNTLADVITDAIDEDVDPKHLARTDDATYDCGSYLCEWLIWSEDSKLRAQCPTAGDLYDYIVLHYKALENA